MRLQFSPKQWIGIAAGGFLIGVLLINGIKHAIKQSHYNNGVKAYEQADCDQALSELKSFLEDSPASDTNDQVAKARAINAECNLLTSVSTQQSSNKPALALATSLEFAQLYPTSPLRTPLQAKTTALFTDYRASALAQLASCQKLEALTASSPIPKENQPEFDYSCGQVFAKNRKYTNAIALYERFLNQFPGHALSTDVKQGYARALYAEAQAQGSGTIPPPSAGGSTGDGSTTVEIRNDSPERMRIVFGGPTPRVEELGPCKDCETFNGAPPSACPNKGPVGRYSVAPGQYQIVVKSIGSSTVTPFTGTWPLNANTRYIHCFYIIRRSPGIDPLPIPDIRLPQTPQ
jgi:outer membrane protein assembly factor BamD (BamD/ComL family)